ncbi:MAG: hypothetical protein CMM55_13680 [Rhodospirillaceae bacterium]|nr:hypothetical protein [Rhodospirillaceae bacterium]
MSSEEVVIQSRKTNPLLSNCKTIIVNSVCGATLGTYRYRTGR